MNYRQHYGQPVFSGDFDPLVERVKHLENAGATTNLTINKMIVDGTEIDYSIVFGKIAFLDLTPLQVKKASADKVQALQTAIKDTLKIDKDLSYLENQTLTNLILFKGGK